MPNPGILRRLRVKRVSLVDGGANLDKRTGDGSHIMLFKGAPLVGDVHVDTVGSDKDEKAAEARRKLEAANGRTKEKSMSGLFKRLVAAIKEPDEAKQTAALDALEKDFPPDPDDVHKGDNPMCKCADCMSKRTQKSAEVLSLEKRSVDLEKANADLIKRVEDQGKIITAEIEKREDGEMRQVLKSFAHISIDVEKDTPKYRAMRKASPEAYEVAITALRAADAQLAKSALYEDVGTRRGTGEGSAWAQIEAKADQMLEKSGASLTREQAIEKVMLANQKLVAQYRQESASHSN